MRTPTCPTRCAGSQGPRAWPRSSRAPASCTSAGYSPPAASSRSTWGRTRSGPVRESPHPTGRRADPRTEPLMAAAPTVDEVVRAAGPYVAPLMARIEERLAAVATGHGELLAEYAGATIAAGGKRLRPLLVLLAAGPRAAEGDGVLRAGVAVEL